MRIFTLAMFFAVGCSQPNPQACCTTADQCLMFGLGGITNCDSTHVCNMDGNCVVPMCKVDADCNDAAMVCAMNGECVPAGGPTDCTVPGHACATGVCDTTSKVCVECIDDNTCSGAMPICHNDTCEACAINADCPESNTCLPTGACAASPDVAYVRANGSGTTCTQMAPCASLHQGLSLPRPYVRLAGAVNESVVLNNDTTKTIIGERDSTGKTITSTISNTAASSTLVTVTGTTTSLTLVDVALVGAANNNDGVQLSSAADTVKVALLRCSVNGVGGYGIETSHGEVDIDRSSITNNVSGLVLSSSIYHVKNTIIMNNFGSSTSSVGGVYLSEGSGTIDFSTIVGNVGPIGPSKGINCSESAGVITNTIAYNNANTQTSNSTTCAYFYSDFYPSDANTPTNLHNVSVNPLLDPTGHLTAGSPMKDAADPTATLTIDWDGDARPQGMYRDIGADELMP